MRTYDRSTVANVELWDRYRKTATTPMIRVGPLGEPWTIVTKEGELPPLPQGWEGYIAIDADGYPYPIELGVHKATYALAGYHADDVDRERTQHELGELIEGAVVLRDGDTVVLILSDRVEWTAESVKGATEWMSEWLPDIEVHAVSGVSGVLVRRDGS